MAAPAWLTERPIAHRGLHDAEAGIPENSRAAALAAIAAGYAIECDVRAARDLTPVVFHDAELSRLTGAEGRLDALTPREIGALRLLGTSESVATLEEFLETVTGRVPVLVEIKSDGGDGTFERGVGERLAAYRGPVAAMSFEPDAIIAIARAAPGIPRGFVSMDYDSAQDRERFGPLTRWARRNLIAAAKTGAGFLAYDARALPAFAPAVARMAGLPILSWTVRSQAERQRIARHVDQIIFEGFRP